MSPYKYYPIKGIPVEHGKPMPLRLEIDDLWQAKTVENENQKSLFVRALQIMQDTEPGERLSYFQIAGIHGMPYHEWDEPGQPPKPHDLYCTHATALFPTWHRPYLLLFEQVLHEIMVKTVIPQFTPDVQDEMREAADTWRLPYWDAAALRGNPKALDVPLAMTEELVYIRGLVATPDHVPNPLWKFRMPKDGKKGDTMEDYGVTVIKYKKEAFYFEKCVATTKYPDALVFDPSAKQASKVEYDKQRWEMIRSCLRDPKSKIKSKEDEHKEDTLREVVYRLFTYDRLKDYRSFATSKYQEGQSIPDYISLEHVHNNLHNWIGGGGHMSHVPVSAFDPIFWLHHCNIDHYFAIWQALNDKSWFEPLTPNGNGPTTDLKPFHRDEDSSDFYNSDLCRNTTALGYAYPETKPGLTRDDTMAKVEELYASLQVLEQRTAPSTMGISLKYNNLDRLRDYVVNVSYERFALAGTPFTIHIFLGDVPATRPYNYLPGSTQVGNVYNFVAPPSSDTQQGCENCAKQEAEGIKVAGQVILTNTLLESIRDGTRYEYHSTEGDSFHYLRSMRRSEVIPFLKANLHWRVTKLDGTLIDRGSLRGLKVSVAVGRANFYPDDSSKPAKYYDYNVAYGVTESRKQYGGVAPPDGTLSTQ